MAEVRVLVVDDQAPFRRAATVIVEQTDGFSLAAAVSTGEESLVAAAELRPDLVLMDVNLPGIDGIEAARQLTSRGDGPVVVLLSTYDEVDFDLEGCGAASYYTKSRFGPDELAAAWAAAT